MMIDFELPMPPSLNASYRNVVVGGRPRTLLSRQAREYKKECKKLLAAIVQASGHGFTESVRVKVAYEYHFKDKRRCDIANREKVLTDCLEGFFFKDDSQIDDMRLVRGSIDKDNPRVNVLIEVMDD